MRALTSAAFAVALFFFGFPTLRANQIEEKKTMNVKKITPVLLVNEIEPVLSFWLDRLGFRKAIEVPDGSKIGFVAFQKGSAEVMYQTYANSSHSNRRSLFSSVESHTPRIAKNAVCTRTARSIKKLRFRM